MRVVRVDEFGGPERVEVRDVPTPTPGVGQILVRVSAAAVQPVDLQTRSGALHEFGLHQGLPVSLGWDVCGIVDEVGPCVRRLRSGQLVVGLSDRIDASSKTHADFVVLDEDAAVAVQGELEPDVLAMLPLNGLTALQALEAAGLERGQSVLITGAAGAVGGLAMQLALFEGIRVIGAGRPEQRERIQALGADFVEASDVARRTRQHVPGGVDAVIDGAHLGIAALDAVRDGGAFVSLVVLERPAPLRGIRTVSVAVRADWKQLTILTGLAATGALRLPVPKTVRLEDAARAYALLESRTARHVALIG